MEDVGGAIQLSVEDFTSPPLAKLKTNCVIFRDRFLGWS